MQRLKRKSETAQIYQEMDGLRHQNNVLQARVRELEFKLYGKCSAPDEIEDIYKVTRIQRPLQYVESPV